MSSRDEEMILLEEANHAIGLVDQHMTVTLWSLTWWRGCWFLYAGQGINGGGDHWVKEILENEEIIAGYLPQSIVAQEGSSTERNFLEQDRETWFGEEEGERRSGTARWLDVFFYRQEKRRRDSDAS